MTALLFLIGLIAALWALVRYARHDAFAPRLTSYPNDVVRR